MPSEASSALRVLFFGLLFAITSFEAGAQEGGEPVDVELVLAVDASWSMDFEEQLIQRDGYAGAFRSAEVIEAILNGGYGKVAVTYLEWAGWESQQVVVPWTLIDSEASARSFAESLTEGAPRHYRRTSISGAINYAANLFDGNGYEGLRRIIDISGDGANNQGVSVTEARDAAVARGLTINGLPLMTNEPGRGFGYDIPRLDVYFSECVIGGGQAFVIPVRSWEEFPEAVRRKLVLELAGTELPVILAQATSEETDIASSDCLIGEKLWERRRQNMMP
jgi:hypothetical protein